MATPDQRNAAQQMEARQRIAAQQMEALRNDIIKGYLHAAFTEHKLHLLLKLLKCGFPVHIYRNKNKQTLLLIAAELGHTEAVHLLLKAGANIHAISIDKDSALHYAAGHGHTDVVQLLLDAGAVRHGKNLKGQIPSQCAKYYGHSDTAALFTRC